MPNHNRTLIPLIAVAIGMLMLAYASVPLYRIFCQATGFGGTTRETLAKTGARSSRTITVRLNGDTAPGLPWKFEPVEKTMVVHPGENRLVAFRATNLSNQPLEGTAAYNVTPFAAGRYFNKIQCFCFERQRINPHETVTLPVSFFIDPAIDSDAEAKDIAIITLSYTFFRYESAKPTPTRAAQ